MTTLAHRLLPEITTVEIGPDVLAGTNFVTWRQDMQLACVEMTALPAMAGSASMAPPPVTFVVLNPGDATFGEEPEGGRGQAEPEAPMV